MYKPGDTVRYSPKLTVSISSEWRGYINSKFVVIRELDTCLNVRGIEDINNNVKFATITKSRFVPCNSTPEWEV